MKKINNKLGETNAQKFSVKKKENNESANFSTYGGFTILLNNTHSTI